MEKPTLNLRATKPALPVSLEEYKSYLAYCSKKKVQPKSHADINLIETNSWALYGVYCDLSLSKGEVPLTFKEYVDSKVKQAKSDAAKNKGATTK